MFRFLTCNQSLRQLAHRLSVCLAASFERPSCRLTPAQLLPPESEVRRKHETLLLDKLYDMGILSTKSKLSQVEHNVTVSAFARRRLPVVMTRYGNYLTPVCVAAS